MLFTVGIMSIEEFVAETLEGNAENVDAVVELQEILDRLPEEESIIYFATITSNV